MATRADSSYQTLEEYLRQYQAPFCEQPFNEVDSLVLSSVVYLNFGLYDLENCAGNTPVPVIDVMRFTPPEQLIAGSWMKAGDDVNGFLMALGTSRRYKDLAVQHFWEETSTAIDMQFCAATFTASGMPPYVAYRGTDGTLAGWKEDFNLSYMDVLPSHTTALRYLSGVLSSFPPEVTVNIGGHSKGGNLAEYCAACIDRGNYYRIENIFNHDGPAFLNPPTPRYASKYFRAKRRKSIPESSIFGMVMEREDNYKVVLSSANGFFQHRPLTWLIEGDHFATQEDINNGAKLFDEAFDDWMRSRTPQQREVFLNAIFDLAKSTKVESWEDFQNSFLQNLPQLLREMRNLDDETRDIIISTFMRLGNSMRLSTMHFITERLFNIANKNDADQ